MVSLKKDDQQVSLEELQLLVNSADVVVCDRLTSSREHPIAATFISQAKVDELKELLEQHGAGVAVFDHVLSPRQERNLEKSLNARIIDRTRLILDIFALRAKTKEGKLQVELAQLNYISTRLVRGWTHLERQKGGIGLRGPGETQLESDRRMIRDRISSLKKRLEKVRSQRHLRRKNRDRTPLVTMSLVGYTNAGKSSLFNRLTNADVLVKDQLFATLDPTMRRLELEQGEVILSDTVGFIKDLPHGLVEAFHSTLEEVNNSRLLLHVIDVSDDQATHLIEHVNDVLENIEANDIPSVYVFNKIDRLTADELELVKIGLNQNQRFVFVSAHSGEGIDELKSIINDFYCTDFIEQEVVLSAKHGKLRAIFFEHQWVTDEEYDEQGNVHLTLKLSMPDWNWLLKQTLQMDEDEFIVITDNSVIVDEDE